MGLWNGWFATLLGPPFAIRRELGLPSLRQCHDRPGPRTAFNALRTERRDAHPYGRALDASTGRGARAKPNTNAATTRSPLSATKGAA